MSELSRAGHDVSRSMVHVLVVACVLAAAGQVCPADEIVLKNGRVYKGLVIERTDSYVLFKAVMGSGTAEIQLPAGNITSVKIDGKMPAPEPVAPTPEPTRPVAEPKPTPGQDPVPTPAPAPGPRTPSRDEIEALLNKSGQTPPDWWDSVALDYPKTLDLTGKNKVPGWVPDKNLGTYLFAVVTPNPSRWRPAVKLMHEVLTVRKDDPQGLGEATLQLARLYHKYLQDWARGAFWYRQAIAKGKPSTEDVSALAECYFKLGSKAMAVELLARYGMDKSGSGGTVRLWGEMGEMGRAMAVAEYMAQRGMPDVGYLAAARALRRSGKLDQAAAAFQKVLDMNTGSRGLAESKKRAQLALEGLRTFEKVDLSRVSDGTHAGSCQGYRGPVEVKVTVAGGKIEKVEMGQNTEDLFYTAFTDIPASLVERQGLKGVDSITGATVTSEAIINAAAKAIADGMK